MQTLGLFACRTPFLNACRRRYGRVVALRTLFGPPFVVVFDRELVGELLRVPPGLARAGAANAASEPLHGGCSLLLLDGDEHLRQRRLLLAPFHGERMRAYEPAIRESADDMVDSWPVGRAFPLQPSLHALTLRVIMRAVFGVGDDREGVELERSVRGMLEAPAGRGFERHRHAAGDLLHAEIRRRRAASDLSERGDVLSALLRTGGEGDSAAMSDAELHDQLMTLLVAGHETAANALAWAFELILGDRRVEERLRETLAAGDPGYLEAVIKETLRLRPVVTGLGRLVCEGPLRLGGYEIPPGVEVAPAIDSIHADPAAYARPADFRPERFLDDAPPPDAWLPFGGGTRRCIGASFATLEMGIVIARVLERSRLRRAGLRGPSRRRGVTPPTRHAFARALRRGRRKHPWRGGRVIQPEAPRPA